jgi:hypothetical protein
MVLLKNNERRCRICAIPQGRTVAVCAGIFVKKGSRLLCQVGLYFSLPERETVCQWNPARGCAHIDNDELNRSRSEELPDTFLAE